jgi:hypothetical protein
MRAATYRDRFVEGNFADGNGARGWLIIPSPEANDEPLELVATLDKIDIDFVMPFQPFRYM